MDAYLSQEAYQSFKALNIISSRLSLDGFLLGHKRGHRFFIENIFTSVSGFFPSLQKYHELDKIFEGKILGFFSFRPQEKKIKKILAPFACGKLFLELNINHQKKIAFKSYIIDYEKGFSLFPVKLNRSKLKK